VWHYCAVLLSHCLSSYLQSIGPLSGKKEVMAGLCDKFRCENIYNGSWTYSVSCLTSTRSIFLDIVGEGVESIITHLLFRVGRCMKFEILNGDDAADYRLLRCGRNSGVIRPPDALLNYRDNLTLVLDNCIWLWHSFSTWFRELTDVPHILATWL
jgi:hypothetical protein